MIPSVAAPLIKFQLEIIQLAVNTIQKLESQVDLSYINTDNLRLATAEDIKPGVIIYTINPNASGYSKDNPLKYWHEINEVYGNDNFTGYRTVAGEDYTFTNCKYVAKDSPI